MPGNVPDPKGVHAAVDDGAIPAKLAVYAESEPAPTQARKGSSTKATQSQISVSEAGQRQSRQPINSVERRVEAHVQDIGVEGPDALQCDQNRPGALCAAAILIQPLGTASIAAATANLPRCT